MSTHALLLRRPRARAPRRGSVLVPVVAAMLILLLAGVALSELFGAQRMQSALAVQSTQAFWGAEAGLWHAAHEGSELTTPVAFAGCTYTVAKDGDSYTSTATRGEATRVVSFTFDASGSSDVPISASPIALWRLDETSGNLAVDSVGGHDGTSWNGVAFGAGGAPAGDTAFRFDGANDYVAVSHDAAFLLDAGTVQFWFNADDTNNEQGLVTKDASGNGNGGHMMIRLNWSHLEARLQSIHSQYYIAAYDAVTPGTWHHVALTFGGEGMALYLDGTLRASDAYTGGLGTTSGGSGNTEPMVFGASTWTSDPGSVTPLVHFFDGRLDSIAIYDQALSASDVEVLYDAGGEL